MVVARAGREASQSSQGLSGDHDQDRRPGGNPYDSNICVLTNPFPVLISPQVMNQEMNCTNELSNPCSSGS